MHERSSGVWIRTPGTRDITEFSPSSLFMPQNSYWILSIVLLIAFFIMSSHSSSTDEIIVRRANELLCSRNYPKTICPSEVPRSLRDSELEALGVSHWRSLMPKVREVLWAMRQRGEVEILQKGEPISGTTSLHDIKGPIRARKVQR